MGVETAGIVTMRGDTGPGVAVRVVVEEGRLRLMAAEGAIGDWDVKDLGIRSLQDGFVIRVAGDEYLLRSSDDALLAEELGVVAASPRLARMVAARHRPEEPPPEPEPVEPAESKVEAIAYTLAGTLVLIGGVFLRLYATGSLAAQSSQSADSFYQWPFMVGGAAMVVTGVAMAVDASHVRIVALVVLALVAIVLGFALGDTVSDAAHLTAFGFIAGGVVIGVSSLVGWGRLGDEAQ